MCGGPNYSNQNEKKLSLQDGTSSYFPFLTASHSSGV